MRVIVVGGFLGAGKTTLMAQAAKHFAALGKSVGIITNDQAPDLVDTHFFSGLGIAVREVAGGCFCCRFEDLERAANDLMTTGCFDVLLTEPVGSCTDISATVLQPMKQKWSSWVELSPYSVLADPKRLQQVFDSGNTAFPDSVRYIIKKQIEEADYLVINKVDLFSPDELAQIKNQIISAWPGINILVMSALENRGVTEWLETISDFSNGGRKIVDIDYDTYANGEAEMGWLNTSISLAARDNTDWGAFTRNLIGQIHSELSSLNAEIGHLKLLLSTADGQVLANATSIDQEPDVRACSKDSAEASLVVNARVRIDPDLLNKIVNRSVKAVAGNTVEFLPVSLHCFKPAYPKPTYRFDSVFDLP